MDHRNIPRLVRFLSLQSLIYVNGIRIIDAGVGCYLSSSKHHVSSKVEIMAYLYVSNKCLETLQSSNVSLA